MLLTRNDYLHRLFETSPYEGFDYESIPLDLQGWASEHPIFETIIEQIKPSVIIEVGSWKGASASHMAKLLKQKNMEGVIFCVDTWLGGIEHLKADQNRNMSVQSFARHGYPQLYFQFLANVMHQGLQDVIIPVPNTSVIGARWFQAQNIQADMIYIDASHDEDDVYMDIAAYWKVLKPGGVMVGDDWADNWYGVICAVNRFARENNLKLIPNKPKWILQKI